MRRALFVLMALVFSSAVSADAESEAEIRQIESQLQRLQQDQQAVYQQFQMIQELRRTEMDAANPQVIQNPPIYPNDGQPPNYDDVVREKAEREQRINQYTEQLDQLYARYGEMDAQKKPLQDRLNELAQQR